MTTYLMPNPKQQFFGIAGIPLIGGKVFTYAAGTSTPKATYTDAAGTTPQANPIILNARGEPANAIFWSGSYKVVLQDALGNVIYTVDNFNTDPGGSQNILALLAASNGASLSGYIGDGVGAVATTVQAVLRETVSATRFGLSAADPDNTAALARIVAYCATFAGTGLLPKIIIPAGKYNYQDSPNWALTGMCLFAQGNVIFQHNGIGVAFNLDGGAAGPGVYGVEILGNLRISGNANTTKGVYHRAVHHSKIKVRPINATTAYETAWAVCCEIDVRCSPVGYPAFTKQPTNGLVLGKRSAGELTSACTFKNPIFEGVASYGINLADAIQNTIIGGTSESNGGGLFVSGTSSNNHIIGLDMEFNTSADVFCQGFYNRFDCLLSDSNSIFNGADNAIDGGSFNIITDGGTRNEFSKLNYGTNTGTFTINTTTVKRSVRNATSGVLDADLQRNPQKIAYFDGPAGNNTVMGSDDQIGGGLATDFSLFHYGAGTVKQWANGLVKFSYSGVGVGFNAAAPIAKPAITGSRGGNVALAALLTSLATYGLITDSTTP